MIKNIKMIKTGGAIDNDTLLGINPDRNLYAYCRATICTRFLLNDNNIKRQLRGLTYVPHQLGNFHDINFIGVSTNPLFEIQYTNGPYSKSFALKIFRNDIDDMDGSGPRDHQYPLAKRMTSQKAKKEHDILNKFRSNHLILQSYLHFDFDDVTKEFTVRSGIDDGAGRPIPDFIVRVPNGANTALCQDRNRGNRGFTPAFSGIIMELIPGSDLLPKKRDGEMDAAYRLRVSRSLSQLISPTVRTEREYYFMTGGDVGSHRSGEELAANLIEIIREQNLDQSVLGDPWTMQPIIGGGRTKLINLVAYFLDFLDGILALLRQGVVHGDLKGDNLRIRGRINENVRKSGVIIDLGEAVDYDEFRRKAPVGQQPDDMARRGILEYQAVITGNNESMPPEGQLNEMQIVYGANMDNEQLQRCQTLAPRTRDAWDRLISKWDSYALSKLYYKMIGPQTELQGRALTAAGGVDHNISLDDTNLQPDASQGITYEEIISFFKNQHGSDDIRREFINVQNGAGYDDLNDNQKRLIVPGVIHHGLENDFFLKILRDGHRDNYEQRMSPSAMSQILNYFFYELIIFALSYVPRYDVNRALLEPPGRDQPDQPEIPGTDQPVRPDIPGRDQGLQPWQGLDIHRRDNPPPTGRDQIASTIARARRDQPVRFDIPHSYDDGGGVAPLPHYYDPLWWRSHPLPGAAARAAAAAGRGRGGFAALAAGNAPPSTWPAAAGMPRDTYSPGQIEAVRAAAAAGIPLVTSYGHPLGPSPFRRD